MNRYIIVVVLVVVLAESVFAQKPTGPSILIGVNGGSSEFSNHSFFEANLKSFADHAASRDFGVRILNAGGPNTKNVRVTNGFWERDANGDLILQENRLVGPPATSKNLEIAVKDARMVKPTSVVGVFVDHGTPYGMALWKSEIDNSEFDEIYRKFGSNTLVRGIHMYCYSGAALKSRRVLDNFDELVQHFPANICKFSDAAEDEMSVGIKGLDHFIKVNDPSLKQLKGFYDHDPDYPASPRLTSDYYEEAVLNLACNGDAKEAICGPKKSTDLNAILCKNYEAESQRLKALSKELLQAEKNFLDLFEVNYQFVEKFLRQKYPHEAKIFDQVVAEREARISAVLSSSLKKDSFFGKIKSRSEERVIDSWFARADNLAAGPGNTTGLNRVIHTVKKATLSSEVEPADAEEFRNWLKTAPSVQIGNFMTGKKRILGATLNRKIHDAQSDFDSLQRKRKALNRDLDQMRDSTVDQVLKTLSLPGVKSRLDNIERCESLPLSSRGTN